MVRVKWKKRWTGSALVGLCPVCKKEYERGVDGLFPAVHINPSGTVCAPGILRSLPKVEAMPQPVVEEPVVEQPVLRELRHDGEPLDEWDKDLQATKPIDIHATERSIAAYLRRRD